MERLGVTEDASPEEAGKDYHLAGHQDGCCRLGCPSELLEYCE